MSTNRNNLCMSAIAYGYNAASSVRRRELFHSFINFAFLSYPRGVDYLAVMADTQSNGGTITVHLASGGYGNGKHLGRIVDFSDYPSTASGGYGMVHSVYLSVWFGLGRWWPASHTDREPIWLTRTLASGLAPWAPYIMGR
jgi:hypothetical protein